MKTFFREKKYLIPIMFMVAIYPIFVMAKVEKISDEMFRYSYDERLVVDFFTYHKMQILLFISVLLICICIHRLIYDPKGIERIKKFRWIFILSGVYSLLIIASALLSEYKTIAMHGFSESHQGMFVQLGYMVVFLSVVLLIKEKKDILLIINSFLAVAVLMSIVIFFQKAGMNIFESDFGKWFISMTETRVRENIGTLEFKGLISGFLYHKDYVGSYYALAVPMALGMGLYAKNLKWKVGYILLGVGSVVAVFFSNSRAGIVGVAFGIGMLALVVLIGILKRNKKQGLVAIGAIMLTGIVAIGVVSNVYHGFDTLTSEIKAAFKSNEDFKMSDHIYLKKVINEEKRAGYEVENKTLIFSIKDEAIFIEDENGNELQYKVVTPEGGGNTEIQIIDKKYNGVKIYYGMIGQIGRMVVVDGPVTFYYDVTGYGVTMVDPKGNPVDKDPIESIGFKGKESLFSARGFIWSRTLPYLKESIILGKGADTFAAFFPHHEYIANIYCYQIMYKFVDKPHSMYVQIAADNGVIALVIFIAIVLMCILAGMKKEEREEKKGLICLKGVTICTVLAYMVTGIINDNRISVAPIFYIILGLCVLSNKISQNDKKES